MNRSTNEETQTEASERSALDKYVDAMYGYTGSSAADLYKGIHFEDSGKARLASIVGWLVGLHQGGQQDFASKLADDIHDKLTYLSKYGGDEELNRSTGEGTITVPRYRVSLGDDGTFGGFSICWYRAVAHARKVELAESLQAGEGAASSWPAYLNAAATKMQLRKELEIRRSYFPSCDEEKKFLTTDYVHFSFAFNGALLYRGPGQGQLFSVTIDPGAGTERFWSIHT